LQRQYRVIIFAVLAAIAVGWKKEPVPSLDLQILKDSKKLPIVLKTSQGQCSEKTGQIYIPKRVTLWQGGAKVTADSMCYTPKNNTVSAKGHVEILHANGTIAHCESIVLNVKDSTGNMSMVRAFSPSRERFTAEGVRNKESRTELTMGSYTPCALCQDQLNPLWSVHAREMVLDRKKKRTEYTDAHFAIFGTPVFYLPYFYIPSVRSSGIVSPNIGQNNQLGGYLGVPYFWAISPEHDITFTPYITTRAGVILSAQYRGHTQQHKTMIEGAINPSWNKGKTLDLGDHLGNRFQVGGEPHWIDTASDKGGYCPDTATSYKSAMDWNSRSGLNPVGSNSYEIHGFVHGKTVYKIDESWRFSGEQWWVSNKRFLETRTFFGNSQAAFLPSYAVLERFGARHYWNVRALNYQGLQPKDRQQNIPYILPEITYAYTSPALWRGSTLSLRGSTMSLYRREGNGMQRVHIDGQWDWNNRTSWGQTVDVFVKTSGAFYALGNQESVHTDSMTYSTIGQFYPQGGVTSRWPWVVRGFGTLAPIVQILLAPENSAPLPPNEDSQSLIFDESNFFSKSRFSGYDRLDQSSRINCGLDWSRHFSMGAVHVFMGQSYALNEPNPLLNAMGIRLGASDYVGQVNAQWDQGDLTYRFRLDSQTGLAKFQQIGWQGGPSWALISSSYAFGKSDDDLDPTFSRTHYNQLVLKVLSKIGDKWTVKSFGTYDFCPPGESGKLMDVGIGIGYQNECFSGELSIQKSYYSVRDAEPGLTIGAGWTVGLSIRLKSIGGFENQDQRFDHGLYPGW
jgi:LPS-assembly protein